MIEIPEIKNLPQSKYKNVSEIYSKGYVRYLEIIDQLGGLMTFKQFKAIVFTIKGGDHYSPLYIRNLTLKMIKDFERLNLIKVYTLVGNIKYFTLRNFAYTIIYRENKTYKGVNAIKKNSDVAFKNSLLKVESYLQNSVIISNQNVNKLLLTITKELLYFTEDNSVKISEDDYNILLGIINKMSIDEYIDKIKNYKDNNVIKIIWVQMKKIFEDMKLKGNIVSLKPKYLKFNNFNNLITIHFISELYILDTHDFMYYKKKLNELYYKFNEIQYNTTRFLKNDYIEKGNLGFEGFNRLGICINIVSEKEREIIDIVNTLKSNYNQTETTPVIDITSSYVDISHYYKASNKNELTLRETDDEFNKLIKDKLNVLQKL